MFIPIGGRQLTLQKVPNPSIAYAIRKLSPAQNKCLTVRRSSDNAELDIGFSGTSLDISSLLAFVGSGNGFVSKWYDQSGNGADATQTTAGYQPKIVNSGTYLAGILYDGADSNLSCGTVFSNVVNSTSFTKIQPSSGGETAGRIYDKTAFAGKVLYIDANRKLNFTDSYSPTAGFWQSSDAIPTTSETKITVTYNKAVASDPVFYINGVSASLTETTPPVGTLIDDSAQTLYIGNNAARARTFAGYINELILFSRIITSTEIAKLNS